MEVMKDSMKTYIGSLFALDELSKSMFPEGMEVGIIEAASAQVTQNTTHTGTIASLSLVLKRENHGKANSHMWWIGAHSPACSSEFAFGTDCGIVFSDELLFALIDRLDNNDVLSAVTGYQRTMSSEMQGDGKWELFSDPSGYFLRQLQR
jgi:cellulose synthase/poly-beta-1,6-N-acetylglucosamine synthase-like glycosyltransferase